MHDILDFDVLYQRYQNFNEICKGLALDHITKRNLRYVTSQFRKMRAALNQVTESSDTEHDNRPVANR